MIMSTWHDWKLKIRTMRKQKKKLGDESEHNEKFKNNEKVKVRTIRRQ